MDQVFAAGYCAGRSMERNVHFREVDFGIGEVNYCCLKQGNYLHFSMKCLKLGSNIMPMNGVENKKCAAIPAAHSIGFNNFLTNAQNEQTILPSI
jgi:hypothetical protein